MSTSSTGWRVPSGACICTEDGSVPGGSDEMMPSSLSLASSSLSLASRSCASLHFGFPPADSLLVASAPSIALEDVSEPPPSRQHAALD